MHLIRFALLTLTMIFSAAVVAQPGGVVPPPPTAAQRAEPAVSAGATSGAPIVSSNAETVQRTFQQIREAGQLRVGVYELIPYAMRAGDGLIGSEIDTANRLAKDMGVEASFRLYDWEQLIPALQRGEIDIIVSGLTITPQRALEVWFSKPYGNSGVGLATNTKMTKDFASLSDLNNAEVAIGVLADSVSEQVARELFETASIKAFRDEKQAEEALVKGMVHAYVRSEPAPQFLALRHPKVVDVPLSKPLLATREAFAVRQGDIGFVQFLNAWIEAREADAWLTSTHKYWFESLGWQTQVGR